MNDSKALENASLIIKLIATILWFVWLFAPGARQDWIIMLAYMIASTAWMVAGMFGRFERKLRTGMYD